MTDASHSTPTRPALVRALAVTIVAALVVAGVALGFVWGDHSSGSGSSSAPTTVDIGFARDMATHHRQAVTMAESELSRGTTSAAKVFAFDINAAQSVQLGEMQGWLESWGEGTLSPHPMAWMGSHMEHMVGPNGLMPGMATPAQMTRLSTLSGKAEDVLFLQLMINHHLGGVSMARYASAHASQSYVRALAANMVDLQTQEISQMEQSLRQLGGTPLTPPAE